jgi:hypothetical protein
MAHPHVLPPCFSKAFQKRLAGKIGRKSFANRISGPLEIHRAAMSNELGFV